MNKIKAYLLLLTIALSAFAAACSSDDNDPVTPEITISENILANGMSFSKAGATRFGTRSLLLITKGFVFKQANLIPARRIPPPDQPGIGNALTAEEHTEDMI